MKRTSAYLGLSALFAAALLAACGGGGSGASVPTTAQNPGATQPGTQSTGSGLKLTLIIPRNVTRRGKTQSAKRRMYVSTAAEGIQLAITPTGGSTTTLYVDISSSSPLCQAGNGSTPNGTETTCAIPIPVLGATETVTGTVTNITPSSEGSNGIGTGFGSGGLVLGVGSTTVTTSGGVNNVALGIGPIAANLGDCVGYLPTPPDPSHFADDYEQFSGRVVVTAGVTTSGYLSQEFGDPDGAWFDAIPTPAPGFSPVPQNFVDVNGSPEPITYTASTSNITLGISPAVTNASTTPVYATPSSFASSGSIATDADYLNDCAFYELVKVNALPTPAPGASPPTITFANNLSATAPSPFTGGPYTSSFVYTVVPISTSVTTLNMGVYETAAISGSDYGASVSNGMGAESSYEARDGSCYDTTLPTQIDATVAASGSLSTTTWQQGFMINAEAPGTCTFVLYDVDTGVVTQPVAVTIAAPPP